MVLLEIYPVGEFDTIYHRRSANHKRGDLKWWTNISLDRDEYQGMMINLVLPDIKKKMPINNNIIVQQDGAKAQLPVNDPAFEGKVLELYGNEDAVEL
jgi:hypothetical protein